VKRELSINFVNILYFHVFYTFTNIKVHCKSVDQPQNLQCITLGFSAEVMAFVVTSWQNHKVNKYFL